MAKESFRDKVIKGLLALGYVRRDDARSSRTEFTFRSADPLRKPLFEGTHRILVGERTSVRYTRTTVAESRVLSKRLLDFVTNAGDRNAT